MAPGYVSPVRHDAAGPVLLLPGSRRQPVERIFPALLAGWKASGQAEAVVLYPSEEIRDVLRAANPPAAIRLLPVGSGEKGAGSVAACAVLTSSGTMSMHCALAGIPGAIAYRANPLTYLIGRMLVRVEYLGIANLLLKEPMYPEYIQGAATPAALAKELQLALEEPERRAKTSVQAAKLRSLLGAPANGSAADWLLRRLRS